MSRPVEIPDKLFFTIREAARICGVKPHVLRYWENEFPEVINPTKSDSGQRVYRKSDIEQILRVRKFLKEDGFTIVGAKRQLKRPVIPPDKEVLHELLQEVRQIQKLL